MKLEAREKTGDVLAEIDELIGSVNKTSAKMRFENLLPTCEIGEEIGDRFVESGHVWPHYMNFKVDAETEDRWNTIGRQREAGYCREVNCECHQNEKDEVIGISQPYILDQEEFEQYQEGEIGPTSNDLDALGYTMNFFGRENVLLRIDYYDKPVDLDYFFWTPEEGWSVYDYV